MYIWVILATFIAALYSYNIAYRSDLPAMQNEPLAQALISKLIIQHQSAALYVAQNTPPLAKYASGTAATQIIYTSGIISPSDNTTSGIKGLISYLPYGFNYSSNVASEIYCLKKANLATAASKCSDIDAVRYLVSYMQIPQRWLNVKSKQPNNDFVNATKETVGLDTSIGYVACIDTACTRYAIRGVEGISHHTVDSSGKNQSIINLEIPANMINNGGFKTACINSGRVCLAQVFVYRSETNN